MPVKFHSSWSVECEATGGRLVAEDNDDGYKIRLTAEDQTGKSVHMEVTLNDLEAFYEKSKNAVYGIAQSKE